ncbi:MAG: WYL domain-containing protein [Alcaligenaceae bacterium]|nr:WYL domain-containing protein [Alcaligenaceae bacterium]
MSKEQDNWPMRWDLLFRYRIIEIIAQWEGRLTTNHLRSTLGIGRQQASKDINAYLTGQGQGNLVYDKHLKGYKPTPEFQPRFTTGTADEYLHLLSRDKHITHTFANLHLGFAHTEVVNVPVRNIKPQILRVLIQAARQNKRVEISYISLSNPVAETRIIAPHTIVCTPLRWHIRAYCEKQKDYRDFVLSRFRDEAELLTESEFTQAQDDHWQTEVEIIICPDSRLTAEQQGIIERDYGMADGKLRLTTRAALVPYMLQAFNIDPHKLETKAEAQQIVVENLAELSPYWF